MGSQRSLVTASLWREPKGQTATDVLKTSQVEKQKRRLD